MGSLDFCTWAFESQTTPYHLLTGDASAYLRKGVLRQDPDKSEVISFQAETLDFVCGELLIVPEIFELDRSPFQAERGFVDFQLCF
jgi:hypothetical protein